MFFFTFGPGQNLRNGIYSPVDGVITDIFMNKNTLDMAMLEVSIKEPFGIMLSLTSKTKFQ